MQSGFRAHRYPRCAVERSGIARRRLAGLLVWMLGFVPPAAARAPVNLWVEGEQPSVDDMHHHAWYDRVNRRQLSGGDWISSYHPERIGEVAYDVDVPAPGTYRFWLRANPVGVAMSFRIDDGKWRPIDTSDPVGRINIAADGVWDHRFIAWLDLGGLELTAGQYRVAFRFEGGIANSGGIDCFLLTSDQGFLPYGRTGPAATAAAAPGCFAWEPAAWHPDDRAPIDLRHLNEDAAGQNGFVRRIGDRLALGNGEPVRFWGVQGDGLQGIARRRQRWWAQRLAAYGVNLVRSGGTAFFEEWMRGDRQAFRERLDNYHAMVAALKQAGVYVYINHLFWNTHSKVTLPEAVFPGFAEGRRAPALLFFNRAFQDRYVEFVSDLMTTPNPYTGLAMADDPAVAFLEIQNESSLLFYSFNPVQFSASEREFIEGQFADWLIRQYGCLEAAIAAWGPERAPYTIGMYQDAGPDRPAAGRMSLYGVHHLCDTPWARSQRNERRAADQLRFMVAAQKAFHVRISRVLREEVGVRQLIVPGNWRTADERTLGALEHYTYTGADIIARNSYFGTPHEHNPRPYRVEVGDRYRDRSALTMPAAVAALHNQSYSGYPFMITENCWNRPNRFRAEYPVLVAAYGALADLDAWVFFALSADPWDGAMRVWGINDTAVLGQFPATALMFRRGDVRAGPVVVHEALAAGDLYAFKGQAVRPAEGIEDPLYDQLLHGVRAGRRSPAKIDPLAFFVGRLTRRVGEAGQGGHSTDLRPYIDRDARTVRSMTDELLWDYDLGVVTINTARAQGATGFLARAGRLELDDVVIESDNAYGSIIAVSLDGKPLASSSSILVQAATEDRPCGFDVATDRQAVHTIRALGGHPLNVRNIEATFAIRRTAPARVAVLDGNGRVTDQALDVRAGRDITIRLPAAALYTWITWMTD